MIELDGIASVADVARVQALRRGNAPALLFDGRSTTFAEVDATASRLANALIASGVRTQERIAYLSKNTDHFLPCLLGVCKARATLAPFNFRLAAPEIARLLEDSGARILFVGPDVADLADQAIAMVASRPRLIALGFDREGYERLETWMEAATPDDPGLEADPEDDVIQLYTSGTTGLPKGVQLTNRNYLAIFELVATSGGLDYEPGDTVLAAMPFFHVAGINVALIAMASGSRSAIARRRAAAHARHDRQGAGQSCVPRSRAHTDADAGAGHRQRRSVQHAKRHLWSLADLRRSAHPRKRPLSLRLRSALRHDRDLRRWHVSPARRS